MSRKEKSLNVRQPCRYKSLWNMKVMLLCWWICSISVCKGLNGPSNHRLSFTKSSSSSLLNFSNVSTEIPSLSTHYSLISSEQQSRILQQQQQQQKQYLQAKKKSSFSTVLSMSLRNGAARTTSSSDNNDNNNSSSSDDEKLIVEKRIKTVRKIAAITVSLASISYLGWTNEAIRSFDFRGWLIQKLDYANSLGTLGLVCYSIAFAVWEIVVGVTTPVETAAGMAFGVKRGILGNACGKIGGAISAFLIGRYILKDFVSNKLEGNEMMGLVKESIQANPIPVALIWRFSFLPEFVKNFGLAVLPLKTIHFITAVVLHGFPFTCLWTFMGAEADMLVRGVVTQPSQTLKLLVSGVYIFGFFISPTLVGLWIKSLQDRQKEKQSK